MAIPAIIFGAITGLSLGITGGGGSILAVPLMIYGLHMTMAQAVPLSLAVVGLVALIGAVNMTRKSAVSWRLGALFALSGMMVSPLVLHFGAAVDQELRLTLFALLMLVVAATMVRSPALIKETQKDDKNKIQFWGQALLGGAIAGTFAGFFGIGGGFIIVPLLVLLMGLPYRQAVGTSLAVIFLISLSGVSYAALHNGSLDWTVFAPFAAGGAGGMTAGNKLAHKLEEKSARRLFALIVVILALWMLLDNLWLKTGGGVS